MANFLKSKAFLATLAGLSLFRFTSLILGYLFYSYGVTIALLLVVLTVIAQSVILIGLAVRFSDIKLHNDGIRLAFLLGLVGNFVLAMSDFIGRRNNEIPLNPLEILSPIISMVLPIFSFFDIPIGGIFLLGFWLPNLLLYYGLFVAALRITQKNKGSDQVSVPQELNNQTSTESSGRKVMSNVSTWTVRIPGQPENPVDTATLQNWAKSGFIRPDTMVTELATGYAYQARQIPGIFSSKSYVTALLLSFFFGVFGVDRFYLGHVGVGLGKLFTFGGLGIWALIDFILIATKNIKDSQGVPLA